jgi:transposase-like protein
MIFEKGDAIKRIDQNEYKVKSQSSGGDYQVLQTELGWLCSCPDAMFRSVECKHILAVQLSLKVRAEVENQILAPIVNTDSCIFCGSKHIVKDGLRRNKHGDIQKFNCLECKKYFTINLGFEKMKHNPQAITSAMQLYFSGESLRKTAESLRLMGAEVSHQTIHNWITKYVGLMNRYLDRITPNVGSVWRADELYLKVKGNMKYLFALMDDQTRFWIAQEVADYKGTSDIRPLLKDGMEVAEKKPEVFITDGAANFHQAFNKEFRTNRRDSPIHISHIHLAGDRNNNKMESFNGELRDREKTMRSLKTQDSPILKGMQIHHNFIRPHSGLDGQTPAAKAGIEVKGENKWLTIIQNASRPNSEDRDLNAVEGVGRNVEN